MSEVAKSEILEQVSELKSNTIVKSENIKYKYLLYAIIICAIMFLLFHAFTCFQKNKCQDFQEPYINRSTRDDPQVIDSFDVEYEVKKLIKLQEKFLQKLQASRMGN